MRSVVIVPTGSSPLKLDRIRAFGAELRVSGADIGEASQAAREAALAEDLVYVEDGEDPELMAGAATVGWEILEDLPTAQAIVVPVGGGNLIAGVGSRPSGSSPRSRSSACSPRPRPPWCGRGN